MEGPDCQNAEDTNVLLKLNIQTKPKTMSCVQSGSCLAITHRNFLHIAVALESSEPLPSLDCAESQSMNWSLCNFKIIPRDAKDMQKDSVDMVTFTETKASLQKLRQLR